MYSYSVTILVSSLVVFIDDKIVKNEYLEKKDNSLFPLLVFARVLSIVIASVLFLFVSSIWFKNDSLLMIFQFSIFFSITAISYGHTIKLQADLNLKKLSIIHFISFIISIIFCLYFSINKYPVEFIIYTMIGGAILNFILLFYFENFEIKFDKIVSSKNALKNILKQSIPFGIAAVSYMVYMRMDTIMIEYFLTKYDVGVYSLAVQAITVTP